MKTAKLLIASLLSLLAIGAVAATVAQALESEWLVQGQTFSELKLKEEKITLAGGPVTLSVPSKSASIECKTVEGSGKFIEGGSDEITAKLGKCAVITPKGCKVGETLTLEAKYQSVLTGGVYYEKLESLKEGVPLAKLAFSGECGALAEKPELTGAVAAEISHEELVKQPLKFSEAISNKVNKELKEDKLAELSFKLGFSTAFLSGEITTALAGANAGKLQQRANFTKICDTMPAARRNDCTGVAYPLNTAVKGEKTAAMKFLYNGISVKCTGAKFEGKTLVNNGRPLDGEITTMVFNPCTNTAGGAACPVTAEGLPYRFFFETLTGGVGRFVIVAPKFKLVCGGITCEFVSPIGEYPFLVAPNDPAAIAGFPTAFIMKYAVGPAGCGMMGIWEKDSSGGSSVGYTLEVPKPLYVTG